MWASQLYIGGELQLSGKVSQSEMNFNSFDFDFNFYSMSDFEPTETQFRPESIDLFKNCSQFCTYTQNSISIKLNCMKTDR